ncbi:MAG: hypothetical protein MJ245_02135 [Clostridia bacterium]|nr:hypothetical protein [Clostridia bacterium]
MRVENVLSGLQSVGFNELKAVNRDSVIKSTADIEKSENILNEIRSQGSEDIASRNVKAQSAQDEITKYQVASSGLKKQAKVLEETKANILEGKYKTIPEVKDALSEMKAKINEISDNTKYQNEPLFEGYDGESFQIPSVRLGGKSYLPLQNLDIDTTEDLNNALATIDSAITKLNNEIATCKSEIENKANEVQNVDGLSYVDASVARELMKSLKSEIYTKANEMIRSQSVDDRNIY